MYKDTFFKTKISLSAHNLLNFEDQLFDNLFKKIQKQKGHSQAIFSQSGIYSPYLYFLTYDASKHNQMTEAIDFECKDVIC